MFCGILHKSMEAWKCQNCKYGLIRYGIQKDIGLPQELRCDGKQKKHSCYNGSLTKGCGWPVI